MMGNISSNPTRKVLVAACMAPVACVRGIARHAREHDWHLVTDMMFTGALPRGWSGDGILACLPYRPDLLAHIRATGLPCVTFGDTEQPADLPSVEPDHEAIGRIAADHLLQRAYRHFAWAPFVNDAVNRARSAAFQARVVAHGCSFRALPPSHSRIGPYWQENWTEHRRALHTELLGLPRPCAIFAANDCVAADLVDACRDAGLKVPEDIAVLGVGDSIACETSPVPLSSVDHNMEEIGYRAALVLHNLMNGVPVETPGARVPPSGIVTRVSTDVVAVTDTRVARALSYIAEHYPNPMLSVCEVAESVGMSRRNLERTFRLETGTTINEHIIAVRMREASRLLRTHPRTKSSEVAALVGIAGDGTFFRTFRRFFGMSPKAHRQWNAATRPPAPPPCPNVSAGFRNPAMRADAEVPISSTAA